MIGESESVTFPGAGPSVAPMPNVNASTDANGTNGAPTGVKVSELRSNGPNLSYNIKVKSPKRYTNS